MEKLSMLTANTMLWIETGWDGSHIVITKDKFLDNPEEFKNNEVYIANKCVGFVDLREALEVIGEDFDPDWVDSVYEKICSASETEQFMRKAHEILEECPLYVRGEKVITNL